MIRKLVARHNEEEQEMLYSEESTFPDRFSSSPEA